MKRFFVTGSLFLALSVPALQAQAADPTYPVDGGLTSVEYGSGWYLRGDIGLSFNGHMKDGTSSDLLGSRDDFDIDDVMDFSVGFGYRINDSFRLEGSLEQVLSGESKQTLSIDTSNCPTDQLLDPESARTIGVAQGCLETDAAVYESTVLMLSGYYDLPKMGKFEPYIGAGIGVARIEWSEEVDAITCVPRDPSVFAEACIASGGLQQPKDGEITTYGGTQATGIDYRLAYSVGAGVGYRITDQILVDANYRYLSTGAGDIDYDASGAGHFANNGFGVHQVRVGLRYELW